MYKILHIFRLGKLAIDNVKSINEYFNDNYHEFWLYGKRNSEVELSICSYRNIKYVKNITEKLRIRKIYEFDKIIYHGVFEQNIIDIFAKDKRLLKKLYLYFWGGDKFYIYDNKWNNLKKKYVINNARGIINILPEEKYFIKKFYHPKGKFFCAKYFPDCNLMRKVKDQENVEKDYIAIQVGHSATSTNQHIRILKLISKFKDENIKVFAPLSYGDTNYAEKVIKEGKRLFGDRFFALTEFLDECEYDEFLKDIDIGIFAMNRQQALGNISRLLYFGKKVYLKERSILLYFYKTKNQCDVYTIDEIPEMDFNEFVNFSEVSKNNNMNIIENLLKVEPNIKAWNKIFND